MLMMTLVDAVATGTTSPFEHLDIFLEMPTSRCGSRRDHSIAYIMQIARSL